MLRRAFALFACLAAAPVLAAGSDAAVVIKNDSLWEIHQLFISSVETEEWGPDQLGQHVIESGGGRFTLTGIPCGAYDVQLVDEDGDACIIGDVPLCAAKGNWVISDADLLDCQAESD
jgi:uncharacterized protein (DUF779 family)